MMFGDIHLSYVFSQPLETDDLENRCREHTLSQEKSEDPTIASLCHLNILKNAKGELYSRTDDASAIARAGYNLLIIQKKIERPNTDKVFYSKQSIGGANSNFQKILSIDLSSEGEFIAVLHQVPKNWGNIGHEKSESSSSISVEREILIFKAQHSGDVAPVKILRSKEINHAVSISFSEDDSEIYIAEEKNNNIYAFSTKADYRFKRNDLKPNPTKKIVSSFSKFRSPSSIDFINEGEILILDKETDGVVSLDTFTKKVNWVLDSETIRLQKLVGIRYEKGSRELVLTDVKGKEVVFHMAEGEE